MRPMRASPAAAVTSLALVLTSLLPTDVVTTSGEAEAGSAASMRSVLVNELGPSGWLWHATEEFVELRNTGDQMVMLNGWELVACLSPSTSRVATRFGPDDVIPPDGYLLLAHIDYAVAGGGAPDGRYDVDVPDEGGWVLRDPWTGYADGVGLSEGLACTEGSPAPKCDWAAGQAVTRDELGKDTDDNAGDFSCRSRTPGR